ncbi:hypothetical protein MMC12_007200 [Toensbergia leucococca]|nr:hypothetical protein [Toensbergia leucococca]
MSASDRDDVSKVNITNTWIKLGNFAMKLSGLQKEVLSLYRKCLREARKKPKDVQENFRSYTRIEFKKNFTLDKKDFAAIEYLLRKGHRQLEIYSSPGIKNIMC